MPSVSPPARSLSRPVCVVAALILAGLMLGPLFTPGAAGMYGDRGALGTAWFIFYFPCFLIGGLAAGLLELVGVRIDLLNLLLLVLGAVPVSLLYAYVLCLPFRLMALGSSRPKMRVPTLAGGLLLLAIYLFFAARFAREIYQSAHPSPEEIARREMRQLTDRMTAYAHLQGTPSGDLTASWRTVLKNRGRHGELLTLDRTRLVEDGASYLDPWGEPYRFGWNTDGSGWVYSPGPNRRDEDGQGDDIDSRTPR